VEFKYPENNNKNKKKVREKMKEENKELRMLSTSNLLRYAIDNDLGWKEVHDIKSGIKEQIRKAQVEIDNISAEFDKVTDTLTEIIISDDLTSDETLNEEELNSATRNFLRARKKYYTKKYFLEKNVNDLTKRIAVLDLYIYIRAMAVEFEIPFKLCIS